MPRRRQPNRSANRRRAPGRSIERAARTDRPESLDDTLPHADVPVVEIHRRVAVAGHEKQLLAQLRRLGTARDFDPAVLIRCPGIDEARLFPDQGHAGVDARGLEPGVYDSERSTWTAHHRGEHEERVLEARQRRGPLVTRVVRIHENVGPGLDLVPGARLRLEHERAAAGARDYGTLYPGLVQELLGLSHHVRRPFDERATLRHAADVLRTALI